MSDSLARIILHKPARRIRAANVVTIPDDGRHVLLAWSGPDLARKCMIHFDGHEGLTIVPMPPEKDWLRLLHEARRIGATHVGWDLGPDCGVRLETIAEAIEEAAELAGVSADLPRSWWRRLVARVWRVVEGTGEGEARRWRREV